MFIPFTVTISWMTEDGCPESYSLYTIARSHKTAVKKVLSSWYRTFGRKNSKPMTYTVSVDRK